MESKSESAGGPSAFPDLPDDPDALPEVPGGWKECRFELGEADLRLMVPAGPDLFLEDSQLLAKNARNDYMPYWAYLWPAARLMAQAVFRGEWPIGTEVLELGSGLGLVGLAALKRGDRVTFSDYDPTALHLCRLNARLNGLADPPLLQLDWRAPVNRPFPVIIGCEVTYDAPLHGALLDLLKTMLAPGGICWLGDPGRYQSPFFAKQAEERGFEVSLFDESRTARDKFGVAEFQMLRLVRQGRT